LWVLHSNVSPQFTPFRSELADAHGFSRGILNLVVLSRDQGFQPAPVWSVIAVAAIFLLLAFAPQTSGASSFDKWLSGTKWVGTALLMAVALSPFVTPYRVVLAPRTFALSIALVGSAPIRSAVSGAGFRWTPIRVGAVGALFFASAMLQTLGSYGGNYSGFLHVAREVADRAPFLRERPALRESLIVYDEGYDGQFVYLMAFDPLLQRFADRPQEYRAFVDNPPYRYGRIGFSLLTAAASTGRPERFPAVMMWTIVAAHFALAAALGLFAARGGMSPLAALAYLAIPSFTSSLMSALPEALAAAGMVAGFLAWKSQRPFLAASSFAAALLVRETTIILVIALAITGWCLDRGAPGRQALLFMLASLLPVTMWRFFVATRLFADFGAQAVVPNPGDFGLPFAGLMQLWREAIAGAQPSPEIAGGIVFPLILISALLLAAALASIRRGPLEIAALIYAAVAISLNYGKIWSHLPSGERGTFELFVCLLLLLLESRGRPAWVRPALATFFAALAVYTFFVAPDASTSRAALLLIR
jgi:hypothetical protein